MGKLIRFSIMYKNSSNKFPYEEENTKPRRNFCEIPKECENVYETHEGEYMFYARAYVRTLRKRHS